LTKLLRNESRQYPLTPFIFGSGFAPIGALLMCCRSSCHPVIEVLEKRIVLSVRFGEA
jgi:hypothetical protein